MEQGDAAGKGETVHNQSASGFDSWQLRQEVDTHRACRTSWGSPAAVHNVELAAQP